MSGTLPQGAPASVHSPIPNIPSSSTGLRCRPGDLAKVVVARNPLMARRVVFVEKWGDGNRWDVTLLGEPVFGLGVKSGRPLIGNKMVFRDASLRPLRGESHTAQSARQLQEV